MDIGLTLDIRLTLDIGLTLNISLTLNRTGLYGRADPGSPEIWPHLQTRVWLQGVGKLFVLIPKVKGDDLGDGFKQGGPRVPLGLEAHGTVRGF